MGRAIRTHRWKYAVVAPDKQGSRDLGSDHYSEEALYDLRADPYELTNLAGLESHAGASAALRERLVRRMVEAGEVAPLIEAAPRRPSGSRHVVAEEVRA